MNASTGAIRLLDAQTVGQIAAGEVVERPLSVVKELVENALDAGASKIVVSIRNGGLQEVDVADDGAGIPPGDLALALRRHATSKLFGPDGLTQIATLGFRGEGLASIAAVARITLLSRCAGADVGYTVEAFEETVSAPEPAAAPPGTRVVVRDLFANVPVRRTYLRSPSAEFARISNWLATLSLAYPRVAFSLAHDGRDVFAFSAGDDPAARLRHVFGSASAPRMLALDAEATSHVVVSGYVSAPGDDRPDRRLQLAFVNRRLLRTTVFSGAWSGSYRTFTMVGRHPYGVLFIDVPPDEVDPNVHPTKFDVRLRFAEHVNDVIRDTIGGALRRASIARLERSISFAPAVAEPDTRPANEALPLGFRTHGDDGTPGEEAAEPRLRVLAQIDRTYILATDGFALVLIDQHAAHERIAYEAFARNAAASSRSEPMLFPHAFEVSAPQAEQLEGVLSVLQAGGLSIEQFGERTFRITATPAGYALPGTTRRREFDVADFLECLTDDVRGLGFRERVWASLACHSVVRAGDPLEAVEMTTLVARLMECRNPMHCPHGRPTIVRLEPDQLARLFKRV